jgi:hypothetical protein
MSFRALYRYYRFIGMPRLEALALAYRNRRR